MGVLVLIPNLKGGLTVAARIWEFAALSIEFKEPQPLGVFDNLRKGRPSQHGSWTEGNIEQQLWGKLITSYAEFNIWV